MRRKPTIVEIISTIKEPIDNNTACADSIAYFKQFGSRYREAWFACSRPGWLVYIIDCLFGLLSEESRAARGVFNGWLDCYRPLEAEKIRKAVPWRKVFLKARKYIYGGKVCTSTRS